MADRNYMIRGYDNLRLNRCILPLALNLFLTVSADNLCKQTESRSGPTE